MALAVAGNARPHDFGKPEDVVRMDAGVLLNEVALLVRPGLGTEESVAELRGAQVQTNLLGDLHHVDEVGGRAADRGDVEVLDHHAQLLGVAAAHRDDRGADFLHALVGTHAAGEEAVTVANHRDVLVGTAAHQEAAGSRLAPDVQVILSIGHHNRLAGGAAGGVNANNLRLRNCVQSIRIGIPQIRLLGKGELRQVRKLAEVFGLHAQLVHRLGIERAVLVRMLQDELHATQLQSLQDGTADEVFEMKIGNHGILPGFDTKAPNGTPVPRQTKGKFLNLVFISQIANHQPDSFSKE